MLAGKQDFAKRVAAVLITLTLVFSAPMTPPASAVSYSQLQQLQQKQATLKKQQKENAAKLKSLKADKARQQEYKAQLDQQVANVQDQIDTLNDQISALDQDISNKQNQIAAKQTSINENIVRFKERIHALYLTGEASNLEIILNAKNVVDLADKTQAIEAITKHDTDLIDSIKTDMASIQKQKEEIQTNRTAVAAARVEQDKNRSELSSLAAETQKVIAEISKDVKDAQAQDAEFSKENQKVDQAIDDWYKQYYASHQGSNGSGGYVSKGNFTWPVPGVNSVTSGFGARWGTFHKGIDISSAGVYGKPIVAADSGRVMMAGWGNYGTGYGGYGNVVAIDHGGGYSTLYGHCSRVAVSTGQQVTKGQVIAYVGNTGDSTGAHCHFEIRVNGVAKNPLNWFSK